MVFVAFGLKAQDDSKQVTSTFVLQNATIIPSPGKKMENTSVIIKDGLIQAVGKNISIPYDAKVIKADSMFVYAGFIDGASNAGIPAKKEEAKRPDIKDTGNPPYAVAGIQPERQVREMLKADDKSVTDMRALGFTMAHVVPEGRMLPGKGAIVMMAGESASDMVFIDDTALFTQFSPAPRRIAPSTIIGVMSKLRDLYKQAEQSKMHEAMYSKNPAGMKRPEQDAILEAFYPVIDGEMPVFMKAESLKEVGRALALQKELGYTLVLTEVKEGWHLADRIKGMPLFLSMDLPEAIKEEKEDEKEDEKEQSEMEMEQAKLEAKKAEAVKAFEMQAAMMAKAGITFGFSTLESKPKDIKANIMRMIEAGLTEDQALAALTTAPAEMLGLSKVAGSIEKGKMANLVVADAPYFEKDANVRYVFVDGQPFEYEVKAKKKKKDVDEETIDVSGTWSYAANAGGMDLSGTLEIKVENGKLVSCVMSNPMEPSEKGEVENADLIGNVLTFTTPYQGMNVEYELTFDGETYEGSMSVGDFGSFEIEGSKIEPK